MSGKFTVVDVREVPSSDLSRRGQNDTLVIYQLEGGAPNTVTVPKPINALSDQDLINYVRTQEEARGRLAGKSLELP